MDSYLDKGTAEAKTDNKSIPYATALIDSMIGFDVSSKFVMTNTVQWWKHEKATPLQATFTT